MIYLIIIINLKIKSKICLSLNTLEKENLSISKLAFTTNRNESLFKITFFDLLFFFTKYKNNVNKFIASN